MPNKLTEQQIEQFNRDGFVSPVRVMAEKEAIALREKMEAFEAAQGKPIMGIKRQNVRFCSRSCTNCSPVMRSSMRSKI